MAVHSEVDAIGRVGPHRVGCVDAEPDEERVP
jgi:hypothetical protein